MQSSELTFGAMTPEINMTIDQLPEFIGPLQRKQSKSSITRSEDQSIPSPPLSPYQNDNNNNTQQNNNYENRNVLRDVQVKESNKLLDDQKLDTIIVLSNKKTQLQEFPLNKYEDYPLVVNAWSNIGSKNYKRSHMGFLRQYASRCKNSKVSGHISKNNNGFQVRRYAPRRIIRNDNSAYNSDSDYNSQFEKVRTRRVAKESTTAPGFETPTTDIMSSPSPVKRVRKPTTSSSPMVHVNIDWESLPDYSPDVSELPNNSRCLKVEWKGQPMSLANDPLHDKLHPAEITLASILRLPCNLYLDSKRRLFMEKVSRMKKGLPFRRTDAQKSCRIDVNKASRLFAAFEKIGWLQDKYFEKFM